MTHSTKPMITVLPGSSFCRICPPVHNCTWQVAILSSSTLVISASLFLFHRVKQAMQVYSARFVCKSAAMVVAVGMTCQLYLMSHQRPMSHPGWSVPLGASTSLSLLTVRLVDNPPLLF